MGSSKLPRGVTRFEATSRNFPKGGYEAAYRSPDGRERTKRFARLIDATQWLDGQRGDKVRGVHVDPTPAGSRSKRSPTSGPPRRTGRQRAESPGGMCGPVS